MDTAATYCHHELPMTHELDLAAQTRLVAALQHVLGELHGAGMVWLQTHISHVLVGGGRAYKLKKALKNSFLDYSTLALRLHACEEELRLNRRLAAGLYLGVLPIAGSADEPRPGVAEAAVEYAVEMLAFDPAGQWDRLAARGALNAGHVDELVALLAPFHAAAAVAPPGGSLGSATRLRLPMQQNLVELEPLLSSAADRETLAALRGWEAQAYSRLAPLMAARLAGGHVRECHGDLHLGNVTVIAGRTTVFDCIEFNDDFRWIDTLSDIAFMAMDLHAHALPALAHRFVDGCLQASGDHAGAALLAYYGVHRALVRAKVALLRGAQQAGAGGQGGQDGQGGNDAVAAPYLALAQRFSRPGRPVLLATHGLSGSGKSTLTQGLLEALGAVRLRADVERKRLAGLAPLASSRAHPQADLYSPAMTQATYAQLLQQARRLLQAGLPVILDATFLRHAQREAARALAAELQLAWVLLHFDAAPDELRRRLRLRQAQGGDASEADEAVLEGQLRTAEPLTPDEAAAAFTCRPLPPGADGRPRADWAPLLARLAVPA